MPFYSWSHSASFSFTTLTDVYCVFDSGVQANVSGVSATFDLANLVHTDDVGIYALYFSASDTPRFSGTGYVSLLFGTDPPSRCFEAMAAGSGHWLADGTACLDPAPPHERVQVYVYPRGGGGSSFPKTFDLTLSGAWQGDLGTAYCAYGTEQNPSAQPVIFITGALVAAAVTAAGGGLLMITALDTMIGLPLLLSNTCDHPPGPFPVFTDADFIPGTQIWSPSSFDKRLAWLKTALWGIYCQCVPASGGAPPALPYPQPRVDPTGPAVGPPVAPIICDNNDVCAILDDMRRQLNGLGQLVRYIWTDTQLIQRQGVPFGYILGTVHSALSGQGQFAVADILGLAVTFTTIPGTITPSAGDPLTYHQVGKISTGTADGWTRSWQPTHSPYLILPVSGAFTLVGWTFAPGVVATITELVREP